MFSPRRFAALLVLPFIVAGCGRNDPPATGAAPKTASQETKAGGPMIWRVGNGTEPQDLDPQVVTGVPEHKVIMAIFEGLLSENPRDLSPEPEIGRASCRERVCSTV